MKKKILVSVVVILLITGSIAPDFSEKLVVAYNDIK